MVRADNSKTQRKELSSLLPTHHLDKINLTMKFYSYILYKLGVKAQTQILARADKKNKRERVMFLPTHRLLADFQEYNPKTETAQIASIFVTCCHAMITYFYLRRYI